jgi:anti-anti-sigma regulatory factor
MIVRLNGDFGSGTQPALRDAFRWITSPVTIDIANAWLGSVALGEVVYLAKRIGSENVTLANPAPMMRRVLTVSQLDRLLRVTPAGPGCADPRAAGVTPPREARVESPKPKDPAARYGVSATW